MNLLYVEFAEGKPVEVLRTGEFLDRSGREVTITGEDLDVYVTNFEAGTAGQDVPIDIQHEKSEAAGWVRRLWREADRLLAEVEWNELGQKLVGDQVYRYMSATIDLGKKVIRSVSLVNFPAVKGLAPVELSEGVYGLQAEPGFVQRVVQVVMATLGQGDVDLSTRAVKIADYLQAKIHRAFTTLADDMAAGGLLTVEERSQLSGAIGEALEAFRANAGEAGDREVQVPEPEWVFYSEQKGPSEQNGQSEAGEQPTENGGEEMTDEEKAQLREELRAQLREELRKELLTEMEEQEKSRAELMEEVRGEVEAEMAELYERRKALAEFAEEITSGDAGLSAKPEDIVSTLEGLDDENAEAVKALLKSRLVDFSERGSSRDGQDGKKKLDPAHAVTLSSWLEQGHSIAEYFELNEDILGAMDSYNLSEFKKEE